MNKQSTSTIKYVYIGAICLLIVTFGVFILEKAHITNFYTKPVTVVAVGVRPVNDVQYSPASPTDNAQIDQEKANGTLGQTPKKPAPGSPIPVSLTAAGQDKLSGPVIVKVMLTDVSSGTCDVTLTQSTTKKSYTASVVSAGNYYTCDGFEIPLEDLDSGSWDLSVTVTSADRTGTANQTIEIKP